MSAQVSRETVDTLTLRQLAGIFFRVGSLAFGGGGATLAMLRQEFCVRRAVMTDEEFQLLFGLSRMVPGMNLLALTVLLGHRAHGLRGAVLSLVALTLPSFAIIILGCELLRSSQPGPYLAGALRGLAVGVAVLILQTTWEVCRASLRSGSPSLNAGWSVLLALSAVLTVGGWVHPAWIVVGGGALGVVAYLCLRGRGSDAA